MWWKYRKVKLISSNFYITAVNKVEPSKKINSLFYSSIKATSVKHGIANGSVVLTEYVSLLATQSGTENLIQSGRILSKPLLFVRALLESIITNVDNLENWGMETKCSSSKLDKTINDVLKDKKVY